MIVVADTGPLHYLVLIGAVDALAASLPSRVRAYTVAKELQDANTPATVRPGGCATGVVQDPAGPPFDPTLLFLDPGEHAAIALALPVDARRLLIDEQAGRAEAERRHLTVTGTLGVLAEAHRAGLLDFEIALKQLRNSNFYLSATLVDTVRRRLLLQPET